MLCWCLGIGCLGLPKVYWGAHFGEHARGTLCPKHPHAHRNQSPRAAPPPTLPAVPGFPPTPGCTQIFPNTRRPPQALKMFQSVGQTNRYKWEIAFFLCRTLKGQGLHWGFICETRNSVNWRLPRGAVGWVGVRGFFWCVGPFGPEIAGGNVGGVLSTLWPLPGALSHPGCAR